LYGSPVEVHLRNESVLSAADIEVNVGGTKRRGPGRIRSRLDRLETVASVRIAQRDAEALEVRVDWRRVGVARMRVPPDGIGLPDFDRAPRTGSPFLLSTRPIDTIG
jgi:hypothetical protein